MRDYLFIGPTPAEEPCAQLGTDYYTPRAQIECRAFMAQLQRQFGKPPGSASFRISRCAHELGTYLEVVIVFNDNSEEEIDYAFNVESNSPSHWDEEAIAELRSLNYHLYVVKQPDRPAAPEDQLRAC